MISKPSFDVSVILTFKNPSNIILTPSGEQKQHSSNGEEYLKEGSDDPILTATAPGIEKNNTPTVYMNPSTCTANTRKSSMCTPSEGVTSRPYEVVYTEKTTESDGSEEVITLHYSLDETNSALFDEVAASESLLMLSEARDNSKVQGTIYAMNLQNI